MNNLSRIYRLVRNFLFSSVNKEFLIFLFFLFLSGTFWLLMALNETYEYEYPVTPRLVGVPKNVVITGDIDDTIYVTIRDKGFTLVTYLTGRKFRPLSFKFTSYAKASGKGIIPHTDIVKQITAQLFGSSKLTKVTPDHMEFFFNYGHSKTVPIRMSGKVVTDNSYYLARTQFFPRQITIYANEHLLDSIKYVTTQPFYISHLGDTVVQEVGLKPIRGVKMVPDRVKMALYPDILTEENIEVPIKAINMPDGKTLRTFPAKVRVQFIVGASLFRSIKDSDFEVVADYNDFASHPSDKCSLLLRKTPPTVLKAHLEMNRVDYLIEQQ